MIYYAASPAGYQVCSAGAGQRMRQRDIFWFWLPLFASWLLMTAEGPLISAAINRLPDEVVMLAAQGIVITLSVTIESPIINLLATSTALIKDRHSYLLVRRFTIHWGILLTLLSILLAYTPLYDLVVVRWLEAPPNVSQWVKPGLRIMILWSATIGWRRFQQGVLIRFGRTHRVAWGTAVRLVASGGTVFALAMWTGLPGVISAAIALMTGVLAEAIFATLAVRPLLKAELGVAAGIAKGPALTYRELLWFHLPLAGTSVLILLAQPMVTSSLARLDNPTQSLAAWPVLFQIMLMARAAAFALPEVVIALATERDSFGPIRRFAFILAGGMTLLTASFLFTPLSRYYIFVVQDMTTEVGELVLSSLTLFLLFPALAAFTSWLRGLLITSKETGLVNLGMVINLVVMIVLLVAALLMRLPGLPAAAVALNLAAMAEILFLAWKGRQIRVMDHTLFRLRGGTT